MIALRALLIAIMFILTACVAQNASVQPNSEYVEIPNPALTMTPGASSTIMVPRHYVEEGVPRGSELMKRGYESVVRGQSGEQSQEPAPAVQK